MNINGAEELNRMIWNAEVGIILPFIEETRRQLLEQLGDILKVPFTTRFGEVITNLNDLEIGHIDSQINTGTITVRYETRQLVQRLREARNALSHLAPLPPQLLLGNHFSDCDG
jgi:hypothetical protein